MTAIKAEENLNNANNVKVNAGKISTETAIAGAVLPEQLLFAEQWELARSGESILLLPALNQIVNRWLLNKQHMIQIQYPGGEEGELWVQELTDWLVSLGIPSNHIVIAAGSGADDVIKFDLIK